MNKARSWFWGLFFLFAAAFIIASQLGVLAPGLSLWKMILSVFLLAIAIKGITYREFFSILIPVAVILILFAKPLGIEAITPWPVLGAAVLASIGLSILFKDKSRVWSATIGDHHGHDGRAHFERDETVETLDENAISCSVNFGAAIKYLHSPNLERADIKCSFGSLKVYFDQAKLSEKGADVYLDCSFSGVALFVPHEWKVINEINASMGGVKMYENRGANEDLVLRVKGNANFSGVEIIFI